MEHHAYRTMSFMSSSNGAGSRMPTNGSRPVAGRPLFGFTVIEFFMLRFTVMPAEGKLNFRRRISHDRG